MRVFFICFIAMAVSLYGYFLWLTPYFDFPPLEYLPPARGKSQTSARTEVTPPHIEVQISGNFSILTKI